MTKFIDSHPDVSSSNREVEYFNMNYEKGDEWYRLQMPLVKHAKAVTIEKSPQYMYDSELVSKRVLKMNPKMKLIVVVRDPVIRAVSQYVHDKVEDKTSNKNKSFEQMLFDG